MIAKLLAATMIVMVAQNPAWAGEFIQYGTMHEAIGQKKMQGRVRLSDVTGKPHLYAVGAEEDLLGEITIVDGQIMLTRAEDKNEPRSISSELDSVKATLLIGAYVKDWDTQTTKEPISGEQLEKLIESPKKKEGQTEPVMFKADGHFRDVRLHVIRGACPMHARLRKVDLSESQKAYEVDLAEVEGVVVGVFARGRIGDLTHPSTSVHAHLVYKGPDGQTLTGHLEKFQIAPGARISIAK